MYYVYSLIISLLIFAILEWKRYKDLKEMNEPYMLQLNNIGNFIALYILITVVFYFVSIVFESPPKGDDNKLYKSPANRQTKKVGGNSEMFDYRILQKIPEEVNTGFGFSMD